MALVQIPGKGIYIPEKPPILMAPTFASDLLIDGTGEKIVLMGKVFFKDRTGTKNIERVGFRFGIITKSGGSGLTVSLQDVSLTTGPPGVPDEVQDQTVAIANGDASFASNTWIRTGTFSANRTVSYGDLLAVVIEFDGSGRQIPDAVRVNGLTVSNASHTNLINNCGLKTSGAWAATANQGNLVLEFSDGTFGTLYGQFCYSAINTHTYNSGTGTLDEYALAFKVPWECVVDGLWASVLPSSGSANFDLVLYEGTTQLVTASIDANTIVSAAARFADVPIAETTLTAGTQYYLSVKPTTVNNVSVYSFDVNNAAQWDAQDMGQDFNYSARLDAGSWDAVTVTRRLLAGIHISKFHASGGSGGVKAHGGMVGGLAA